MLKYVISIFTVSVFAVLTTHILKNRKNVEKRKKHINKVIFFNEKDRTCSTCEKRQQTSCNQPFCPFSKLTCMISYLDSAVKTLDVCLYLITVDSLAKAIVRAQKRGVQIRVVTDEDMSSSSGSKIIFLRQNGLNIRTRKSSFLMHHKFVVVDNSLLLTGSVNWTMQALFGNWDNLIITNQESIVEQFSSEFNRMWEDLKTENH